MKYVIGIITAILLIGAFSGCEDSLGLDDNAIINPWDTTQVPRDTINPWMKSDSVLIYSFYDDMSYIQQGIPKYYMSEWILSANDLVCNFWFDTTNANPHIRMTIDFTNHNEFDALDPAWRFDRTQRLEVVLDSVMAGQSYLPVFPAASGRWSNYTVESKGANGLTQYTLQNSPVVVQFTELRESPDMRGKVMGVLIYGRDIPTSSKVRPPYETFAFEISMLVIFNF
ncbi:MAG: hypothetical protein ACOCX7_05180 [Bacteroidota bacterium]